MIKQRKIPMRRCTGCMEMKNKKELVRIVHSNDDEISLDLSGKKNGRGAYVCKNVDCLAKAEKNKGLERSLSCAIPKKIYALLKIEFEKLLYENQL